MAQRAQRQLAAELFAHFLYHAASLEQGTASFGDILRRIGAVAQGHAARPQGDRACTSTCVEFIHPRKIDLENRAAHCY